MRTTSKKTNYNEYIDTEALKLSIKKKAIQGGVHNAVSMVASLILRLGSVAVLARILVPEDFGVIGVVMAFTLIAERFRDLGLSLPVVQNQKISHEQVSGLFWINAAFGCLMMGIVYTTAWPIAWF